MNNDWFSVGSSEMVCLFFPLCCLQMGSSHSALSELLLNHGSCVGPTLHTKSCFKLVGINMFESGNTVTLIRW